MNHVYKLRFNHKGTCYLSTQYTQAFMQTFTDKYIFSIKLFNKHLLNGCHGPYVLQGIRLQRLKERLHIWKEPKMQIMPLQAEYCSLPEQIQEGFTEVTFYTKT